MGLDGIGQASGCVLDEDVVLPEAKVAIGSMTNADHLVAGGGGGVRGTVIPDFFLLGDISGKVSFILSSREVEFLPNEP